VVEGLGGLRIEENRLVFRPRLPESLREINFRVMYRGARLLVTLNDETACYRLLAGEKLSFWHYDEELSLDGEAKQCRALPPRRRLPRPPQPPGRQPSRARTGG
jgi:alpha,alpha-trehalose phosphorylase